MRHPLVVVALSACGIGACLFPSVAGFVGDGGPDAQTEAGFDVVTTDSSGGDAGISDGALDVDLTCPDASDPTLEAYYRLDEGSGTVVNDCSGHGRNGVLITGGNANWGQGKHGNALVVSADAGTGCVQVTTFPDVPNLSIAAWINVATEPSGTTSFAIDKTTNINVEGWRLGANAASGYSFGIGTDAGLVNLASTGHPGPNVWVHVVAIFTSAGGLSLYVNGTLDSSKAAPASFIPSSGTLHFGCRSDNNPANYFDGMLDEIRIYKGALTATQIQTLAN